MLKIILRVVAVCAIGVLVFLSVMNYKKKLALEYYQQAVSLVGQRQYASAVEYYTKAIKEDPKAGIIIRRRGFAYDQMGNKEKALADYLKASELSPNDQHAFLNAATAYFSLNQRDKAFEYFQKASQINPNFSTAWNGMGNVYDRMDKNYQKAREMYAKAAQVNPNDLMALGNQCLMEEKLGLTREGLDTCNRVISKNPNATGALISRGNIYLSLNQFKQAEEDFNKIIQIDPNEKVAFHNLGIINQSMADYESSIKNLEKALAIDPAYFGAKYMLARAYFLKQDFKKARQIAEELVKDDPTNYDGWYMLSQAYAYTNQIDKSLDTLTKLIDLNNQYWRAFVARASLYANKEQFDKALVDIERGVSLNPKDVGSLVMRARLYLKAKQYQKALGDYLVLSQRDLRFKVWVNFVQQLVEKNGSGPIKMYDANGSLISEITYVDGAMNGEGKLFYKSGQTYAKGSFKNDKPNGLFKYFDKTGKLIEELTYLDGKLDGQRSLFDEKGILVAQLMYRDNQLNGIAKYYDENGKLKRDQEYFNNKLDGKQHAYFASGREQYVLTYKDNVMLDNDMKPYNGVFKFYYESGALEGEVTIANGKPAGEAKIYYEDGKVKFQGAFSLNSEGDELASVNAKMFNAQGKTEFEMNGTSEDNFKMTKYDKDGKVEDSIDNEYAKAMRINNQAFEYYEKGENLELGLAMIEKSLAVRPKDPIFLSTKAELLFKLGRLDEAYQIIQEAITIDPKLPELQEDLQMIQAALEAKKK